MNTLVAQRLWKWKPVAGLLTIIVGVVVVAWPWPSILVASTLFGVYLLMSGLAELFVAFTMSPSAATRVMLFISGALSLVLAILSSRHCGDGYAVLLWPFDSIAVLTLAARIWLVVIGISQIVQAFQTRKAASTAHRLLDGSAEHLAAR